MYNLHLYKYENNKLKKISTYQSKNCSSSDKGGVFKSIEKMIMYIIRLNMPAVIFSNGIPKEKIVKNLLENFNFIPDQNWRFSPDAMWLISPDANTTVDFYLGEFMREYYPGVEEASLSS